MKKQEIPIFFTIDEKYVPFLDVAIRSMIKNSSDEYCYKVNVLYQGLNEEQKQAIVSLSDIKENFDVEMVYMEEKMDSMISREKNWFKWTISIYFRLFIAEMFPEIDKGIYLDSDIILLSDIAEIYNSDLGDNVLGAVHDCSVESVPVFVDYIEQAVGVPVKEYVNSGVLVMNLKKMRELEFTKNFMRLLNTYHFDNVAPDQDYFNAMCNGKILYLDTAWDTMPMAGEEIIENPKLIHYNLLGKPWHYDVQYQDYFWDYAKESPFYEEIKDIKNNYSDEVKAFDAKAMHDLLEKAVQVPNQDVTFRKIFEKGEKIRI